MARKKNKHLLVCYVALRARDRSGDIELQLCDQELEWALSSHGANYFPLIESADLNTAMDSYLPRDITGSITVDISPSSYGYQRRFLDLLERYALTGSAIRIESWLFEDIHNNPDSVPSADRYVVGTASVRSWQANPGSGTLSIQLQGETIERRRVTRTVSATDYPQARSAAGKNMPLVLGKQVQTKLYFIQQDTGTTPLTYFASQSYAANVATLFDYTASCYHRNIEGDYEQFDSYTGGVSTPFIDYERDGTEIQVFFEKAHTLRQKVYGRLVSAPTLITKVRSAVYIKGNSGTDTPEGTFRCRILKARNSGADANGEMIEVAKAEVDAADVWTGGVDQTKTAIEFALNRPFVVDDSGDYWVEFSQSLITAGGGPGATALDTGFYYDGTSGAGASDFWWISTEETGTDTGAGFYAPFASGVGMYYQLFGVEYFFYEVAGADDSGVSIRGLQMRQDHTDTPGANLICPLEKENFIFLSDGPTDGSAAVLGWDRSGTDYTPRDLIEELSHAFVSGAQSVYGTTFDQTAWWQPDLERKLAGAMRGEVTYDRMLGEVLDSMSARLAYRVSEPTNKLQLWVWGQKNTRTERLITENESKILSLQSGDLDNVITAVEILYQSRIADIGDAQDVENARDNGNYLGRTFQQAASDELSLYVVSRPNGKKTYPLIEDEQTARIKAEYLLARYSRAYQMVTVEVPFYLYKDVDLLDVVRIQHPDLPSFFGTSFDEGYTPYDVTGLWGSAPTAPGSGFQDIEWLRRAKTYRGQVEARRFKYSKDSDFPLLELDVFLLLNPLDPT